MKPEDKKSTKAKTLSKYQKATFFSLGSILLGSGYSFLIKFVMRKTGVYSLSFVTEGLNRKASSGAPLLMLTVAIYMFIPLISALICWLTLEKGDFKSFWKVIGASKLNLKNSTKQYLIAITFPLLSVLMTIAFSLISGLSVLNKERIGLLAITLIAGPLFGATVNALFAFGEESGWRGYLYYLLREESKLKRVLFTGTVWGLWHAPLILLGYNFPHFPKIGIPIMVIATISLSFIADELREKSESVWSSSVFHGTINAVGGSTLLVLMPSQKAAIVAGPQAENMLRLFSSPVGLFGAASFLLLYLLIGEIPFTKTSKNSKIL